MRAMSLPARHTGRGRQVQHDGMVITLRSNLRWCSDAFEILCWNGKKVRVAFVLDTCDCEVIRYVGTTAGISGEMDPCFTVRGVRGAHQIGPFGLRLFGRIESVRRSSHEVRAVLGGADRGCGEAA